MDDPGKQLRHTRERLRLKYRDVEEASQQIAQRRGRHEFLIGLSRLADIENKGTLPSLYRLYSLCAIYGLSFNSVLTWYGIDLDDLAAEAAKLPMRETRFLEVTRDADITSSEVPLEIDQRLDLTKTIYLSPHVRRWGKLPLSLLAALDLRQYRYAFIGTEDWFMHPILPPGSFLQIDQTKRRPPTGGYLREYERPIHLLEHRSGYRCGWCTERNGLLIVQPHPASQMSVEVYRYPGETDILGQVTGVAMRMDLARQHHTRS